MKNRSFKNVVQQLAHDLLSPLASLKLLINANHILEQEKRNMANRALNRIHEIVEELLGLPARSPTREPSVPTVSIVPLIESVVREKKLSYSHETALNIQLNLPHEKCAILCQVPNLTFEGVVSNLLNNAIESVDGCSGFVGISLVERGERAILTISDNGKGFPKELLPKFEQGERFTTKLQGHGLGLFSAKEMVRQWRGSLYIRSTSFGTHVILELPTIKKEK